MTRFGSSAFVIVIVIVVAVAGWRTTKRLRRDGGIGECAPFTEGPDDLVEHSLGRAILDRKSIAPDRDAPNAVVDGTKAWPSTDLRPQAGVK
jgi:hypothetical protein